MRPRNLILTTAVGTWLAMAAARLLVPPRTVRRHQVEHLCPIDDPRFPYAMGVLLPPAYLDGNRIRTLCNGDEAFPAMLEAIDAAEMTITLVRCTLRR